jgi:hypothetical protein
MTELRADMDSSRPFPLRLIVLGVLVLIALLLAVRGLEPPPITPASAPATAFSAERAMVHVRAISREPRPHNSPAALAAKRYLIDQLIEMGVPVQTERSVAIETSPKFGAAAGGPVMNIVARLPGRDPRLPAIVLMAHTDSRDGAPGAGDDASGSGTVLEIMRALKAGGPTQRDVIALLTDGEETGLLGARAWFRVPANVARTGAVFNFEARGSGGRPSMFQTGPSSAGLVADYLAGPGAFAQSPSAAIYGLLPNDTDLTPAIAAGLPGLNFAFIGGEFDYHGPTDSLTSLDPRSIEAEGASVLPVIRRLADSPALPPDRGGLAYGQVPGLIAVQHPLWAGWLAIGVAAAALAGAAALRRVPVSAIARGAGAGLWLLLLAASLMTTARALTGIPQAYASAKPLLADMGGYTLALALIGAGIGALAMALTARGRGLAVGGGLAFIAALLALISSAGWVAVGLAAGGALAALGAFGSRSGDGFAGWLGCLALALVLALAAQLGLPALAPVLLWPALAACLAALAAAVLGPDRPLAWGAAALIVLLPLAHVLLMGALLVDGIAPIMPGVIAISAFAAMLLTGLLLASARRQTLAAGLAAVTLGLVLMVTWPWWHRPSARHPQLVQTLFLADPGASSALRYTPLTPLKDFGAEVLKAEGGTPMRQTISELGDTPVWAAAATPIPTIAPPTITLGRDGPRRVLTVIPQSGRVLQLRLVSDVALRDVSVNGTPAPGMLDTPGAMRIRWVGGGVPFQIAFTPVRGGGALGVDAVEYRDGWPARARPLPPMPKNHAPFLNHGSTAIIARARLGL